MTRQLALLILAFLIPSPALAGDGYSYDAEKTTEHQVVTLHGTFPAIRRLKLAPLRDEASVCRLTYESSIFGANDWQFIDSHRLVLGEQLSDSTTIVCYSQGCPYLLEMLGDGFTDNQIDHLSIIMLAPAGALTWIADVVPGQRDRMLAAWRRGLNHWNALAESNTSWAALRDRTVVLLGERDKTVDSNAVDSDVRATIRVEWVDHTHLSLPRSGEALFWIHNSFPRVGSDAEYPHCPQHPILPF